MKKFWNLMLAALVIIGATACTENYENIENAESFSFYAEIGDDTRATINKVGNEWKTTFEGGEILMVNGYTFTNTTKEPGMFTCTAEGVSKLAGTEVTITTDGTHHSRQGKNAFYATATVENFGAETVKLTSPTSFFRLTYNGESDLTLTLTEAAFKTDAKNTAKSINVKPSAEEQFIAFWPTGNEVTLSYSTNGQEGKSVKKAFTPGMVYNLGTLNEIKLPEYKIYIHKVHNTWGNVKLYSWYNNGKTDVAMTGDWPGTAITAKETINGYEYLVYTMPTLANDKQMKIILNNGSAQTADFVLGTLDKDYYVLLDGNVPTLITDNASPATNVRFDIFLRPNSNWKQSNARFAAYFFVDDSKNEWHNMTDVDGTGNYYGVDIPNGYKKVIFCRMNPSASANNWNNKWNQTGNLTIPTDGKNLFYDSNNWWDTATGTWSKW